MWFKIDNQLINKSNVGRIFVEKEPHTHDYYNLIIELKNGAQIKALSMGTFEYCQTMLGQTERLIGDKIIDMELK